MTGFFKRLRATARAIHAAERKADRAAFMLGTVHAARTGSLTDVQRLSDVEFGVYSQWGEDGIIEFLVSRIDAPNAVFVEFGVQDYQESNTRFLLRHRNWTGLVIDGSESNVRAIRDDALSVAYDLRSVAAFITAENINDLIRGAGIEGDIGLLSIDIDGVDYWVWRAIDVVSPRVVVCEYNSVFGGEHAVTVPYDPRFDRSRAHYSNLCFGASLAALRDLAKEKGYVFVGCNTAGVNAFFVRADCAVPFAALARNAAFVDAKFRESLGRSGERTLIGGRRRAAEIADCEVMDVRTGRALRVRELVPSLL